VTCETVDRSAQDSSSQAETISAADAISNLSTWSSQSINDALRHAPASSVPENILPAEKFPNVRTPVNLPAWLSGWLDA
jgi:hypothetical protein